MKTSATRHWRKWILSATSVGLLAAVMSTSAAALPTDASGNLDINNNGYPRLATDACYASNGINASGQSDFPVGWRVRRDGTVVSSDMATMFRANNGTIQFQPGTYQLFAVNETPNRPARVILSLTCQ